MRATLQSNNIWYVYIMYFILYTSCFTNKIDLFTQTHRLHYFQNFIHIVVPLSFRVPWIPAHPVGFLLAHKVVQLLLLNPQRMSLQPGRVLSILKQITYNKITNLAKLAQCPQHVENGTFLRLMVALEGFLHAC